MNMWVVLKLYVKNQNTGSFSDSRPRGTLLPAIKGVLASVYFCCLLSGTHAQTRRKEENVSKSLLLTTDYGKCWLLVLFYWARTWEIDWSVLISIFKQFYCTSVTGKENIKCSLQNSVVQEKHLTMNISFTVSFDTCSMLKLSTREEKYQFRNRFLFSFSFCI